MSGFLNRWSRLKRGEAQEPPAAPVAAPEAAPAPAEEPAFDLSLLPSLEELTAESDLSLFLHKAVPEALRNAALRKIWALDPAIRDFVGPVDYAWDFNAPEGIPGIAERLTGDVTELLARAIGAPLDAAPQQEAAPVVQAAAPQPEVSLPVMVPQAEEISAPKPPETPGETAPIRRRHGGARPV